MLKNKVVGLWNILTEILSVDNAIRYFEVSVIILL